MSRANTFKGFVVLSPLLLTVTAAGHAENRLDSVVVTGSRAPTQISQVPGSIHVVYQEQIEEQVRSGKSLKEALGTLIPSMDVGPQGRTNYGQNMRGRSVLVMIDGVSLNSSRGLSRQFDSIDPFNIQRIEVLSGASAIYGGGATGGIVNIITKKGQSGPAGYETELGVTSGFNNSDDRDLRAAQSVSGGNDTLHGRLGVAVQKNGSFYDGNGDAVLPDISQTDLQENRSVDLLGSLEWNPDENQNLQLLGQFYDSGYDGNKGLYLGENLSAVTGADPEAFDVRSGFSSDREPATRRYQLSANYRHGDVLGQTLYLQAFTRSETMDFHPFPYLDRASDPNAPTGYYSASRQSTDLAGLKAMLVKDWNRFRVSYGVDYDRETFDSDQMLFDFQQVLDSGGLDLDRVNKLGRYPDYQVDSLAAFVQADWQITDTLRFSSGLRHQRMDVEVDDFIAVAQQVKIARGQLSGADAIPGGSNDYHATLFNAGFIQELNNGHQFWINYSQGFELADPAKYYGRGSYDESSGYAVLREGIDVDGQPMDAIKTEQVELGWRGYGERWNAQSAVYYSWSDKTLQINSGDLSVDVEDDKKRNYGIEAQLDYSLTDQWSLGGNAHIVRSEEKNDGEWDPQLATTASLSKATAYLGWQQRGTRARVQSTYVHDLDDDYDNEIDGYTLVDVMASQRLPVGTVSVGVQNLFDRDYGTIWGQRAQLFYGGYYGPDAMFDQRGRGRTYTLSYSVKY